MGRNSAVLKVTPKGGEPYHIWVDKETDLPLQRESGMLNSIQYRVTFTDITPNVDIPKDLFIYKLPQGFKEIEKNPEQVVETIKEAGQTAGFSPEAPWALPDGFEKDSIALADNLKTVRQYFKSKDDKTQIILMQGKALKGFKPDSKAIIGKVNGNPAEIQISLEAELGILSGGGAYGGVTDLASIRWQEADFEYAVLGNAPLEVLAQVIKGLSERQVEIPSANAGSEGKPQVEVPVNMEAEENEQKSVDGGHSPWKLDPLYVAQVYVSLIISPEGITGDYPVAYENFKAVKNTGGEAVIEINDHKSPVSRVYLKKLVRNDSTGIWTVIGYDPAK